MKKEQNQYLSKILTMIYLALEFALAEKMTRLKKNWQGTKKG